MLQVVSPKNVKKLINILWACWAAEMSEVKYEQTMKLTFKYIYRDFTLEKYYMQNKL